MAGDDEDEFYDSDEDFVWSRKMVLSLSLQEEGGIETFSLPPSEKASVKEVVVEGVVHKSEEEREKGEEDEEMKKTFRAEERDTWSICRDDERVQQGESLSFKLLSQGFHELTRFVPVFVSLSDSFKLLSESMISLPRFPTLIV